MEENKNRHVKILVSVLCLAVAAIILYKTFANGPNKFAGLAGKKIWVLCANPNCKAAYQIDEKEYFLYIKQQTAKNPLSTTVPALVCEKCGQESVYRAVKCPKCGTVFYPGLFENDFPDRCPKCHFSQTEQDRASR